MILKCNVLMVDDNKKTLNNYHSELFGFIENIFATSSQKEALNIVSTQKIDIAVLDINMPEMSGFEVATEIHKLDSSVKIIMLSANDNKDSFLKALKNHADDYLVKPCSSNLLVEKIKVKLNERIKEESHVLENIKNDFKKKLLHHFPENFVKKLLSGKASIKKIKPTSVTVLVADINRFSKICNDIGPKNMCSKLYEYFEMISKIIEKNSGFIDTFIGDSLVAIFPCKDSDIERSVISAVKSAKEIKDSQANLNRSWGSMFKGFEIKFAISHGVAALAPIGNKYTAVGNAVNLTSRIERLTPPGEIYLNSIVRDVLPSHIKCDFVDKFDMKDFPNLSIYKIKD